MALGNRRSSIALGVEASFGSVDAATGLIAATGLTYTPWEAYRTSITWDGHEQPVLERDLARASLGSFAPEAETMWSGGVAQERRTGTLRVEFPWRCPGTTTTDDTPIGRILRTVMGRDQRAPGATATVVDPPAATVNSFQVTVPGAAAVGGMLAQSVGGRIEYTAVTDTAIGVGPLTVSPALSAAPANAATMRYLQTFFPAAGVLAPASYPSVALRMDTEDRRTYHTGCRLQKLTMESRGTDGRTLVGIAEFRFAGVQDDHGNAAPANPTVYSGGLAKFLGSYAVYTGSIGTGTPAALGRNVFACRRWSMEIEWTLDPLGYSNGSIVGVGDWQVGDVTARLTVVADPVAALDDMVRLGEYRSILIGCEPNNGAGNGFAVYMPAARLSAFNKPVIDDMRRVQEMTFTDGPWTLDTGVFAEGSMPDTPFRLGFVA